MEDAKDTVSTMADQKVELPKAVRDRLVALSQAVALSEAAVEQGNVTE